ncbi:hypothetical protein L1856_06695 [Streptomyces sp. Tue 6430]|nr:hypothetical protein [Streptomyces sp. Tue 6430]
MAIMFPPGLREFIEVWVGANVATGNEDLGFDSRNPYKRLADDVRDLSDAMKGAISTAGNSLPPRIAGEFVAAMKLFVDDNGHNHLQKFSDELRDLGSRQVDRSIKLSEAKYQILLEFILMNIELALIAALAVFTGGTSLTEIAIQKARTALTILLLLQRLGRAVPTPLSVLLEAIQEAFVSFASQLISMTAPDDPERRRDRFDWKDIGQSAVAGAFAGLFGGVFGQVGGKFINKYFKNNNFWKEASELPFTFVNEGQAETFAEAFTSLVFLGTFTLNPGTFLSAGLSGLVFEAASTGAEFGGSSLTRSSSGTSTSAPTASTTCRAAETGTGTGMGTGTKAPAGTSTRTGTTPRTTAETPTRTSATACTTTRTRKATRTTTRTTTTLPPPSATPRRSSATPATSPPSPPSPPSRPSRPSRTTTRCTAPAPAPARTGSR